MNQRKSSANSLLEAPSFRVGRPQFTVTEEIKRVVKDCCPYCYKHMAWQQWKECWLCDTHGRFGVEEAVEASLASTPVARERICKWLQDEDGIYQTDCGNAFEISNEDSPSENKFKYCTFCGALLQAGDHHE